MLIDGALVNGSWKLIGGISARIRRMQTGYIYHYAFSMLLGVFVLLTYFVWSEAIDAHVTRLFTTLVRR